MIILAFTKKTNLDYKCFSKKLNTNFENLVKILLQKIAAQLFT